MLSAVQASTYSTSTFLAPSPPIPGSHVSPFWYCSSPSLKAEICLHEQIPNEESRDRQSKGPTLHNALHCPHPLAVFVRTLDKRAVRKCLERFQRRNSSKYSALNPGKLRGDLLTVSTFCGGLCVLVRSVCITGVAVHASVRGFSFPRGCRGAGGEYYLATAHLREGQGKVYSTRKFTGTVMSTPPLV